MRPIRTAYDAGLATYTQPTSTDDIDNDFMTITKIRLPHLHYHVRMLARDQTRGPQQAAKQIRYTVPYYVGTIVLL